MLVGLDEPHVRAARAVEHGGVVHLEAAVVAREGPRPHVVRRGLSAVAGDVEGDLAELVCPALVKEHVLARGARVTEAVADVEAEFLPVHETRGAAPVPRVFVRPHAAAPVEHGEAVRRVEGICAVVVAVGHGALGAHAVDLLVVVKVLVFVKRRGDDHGLGRDVRERHLRVQRALGAEVFHLRDEHAAVSLIFKQDAVVPPGAVHIAGLAALGQADAAVGEGLHRAFRDLPPLVEVEQGDGVEPHVAVVRDGQGQGKVAVVDAVVVPFLDAQLVGFDVIPAVDGQQGLCVAGLCQVAARVEQWAALGDLVLIHASRSFLICRMSRPTNGSVWYSPSMRDRICGVYFFCSSSLEQFVLMMVAFLRVRRVLMSV